MWFILAVILMVILFIKTWKDPYWLNPEDDDKYENTNEYGAEVPPWFYKD